MQDCGAMDTHPADGRVQTRTLISLCLVEMLVLGSVAAPIFIALPLRLAKLDLPDGLTPEGALARIAAVGAFAALVGSPVFGWLADRSTRRHRANWIAGGVVSGALLAPLLMAADALGSMVVVWSAIQFSYGAAFAGLYGTLADAAEAHDRSRAAGWFAASGPASYVLAFGFMAIVPHVPALLFMVVPTVTALVALLALRHLRVPKRVIADQAHRIGLFASIRRASSQFWLILSQRFLAQLAYQIGALFGVFVLIRRAGLAPDRAATWVAVTVVVAAAASTVAAVLAGRIASAGSGDLRPIMAVGLMVMIVALGMKVVVVAPTAYAVTMVLLGMGIGAYFAVDLAAVLRVIPDGLEGYFLGLFAVARTLPQALAPAIGPLLLAVGAGDLVGADRSQSFAALFAAGGLSAAAALLLVRWITSAGPGDKARVHAAAR